MKFRLPRDLIVDTDNIPEDFEVQVQKVFAEYTEMTSKDYTFQDKLMFIDVCVGILHGDKYKSKAVMELMKDTFEYQISEYGTFPNESDFLSAEFMETCYEEGKNSQYLHFRNRGGDHEIEKIEKMLIRLIRAVLDYEKGQSKPEWLMNRCTRCGAHHESIYRNFCPNCGVRINYGTPILKTNGEPL